MVVWARSCCSKDENVEEEEDGQSQNTRIIGRLVIVNSLAQRDAGPYIT